MWAPDPHANWCLPQVLRRVAAESGDAPWIQMVDGEPLSAASCLARAEQTAAWLHAQGVSAGTHVGVMLGNSLALIDVWLALGLLGAVHVAINPELEGKFLRHQLELCDVRLLIAERTALPALRECAQRLPRLDSLWWVGEDADALAPGLPWRQGDFAQRWQPCAMPSWPSVSPGQIAMIMCTSGTTGPAKAVLMPHAHCYLFALGSIVHLGVDRSSVYYVVLPLFHANGLLMQVYASLVAGGRAVLRRRFSASAWRPELARHGCTHTHVLGAIGAFLLAQPEQPEDRVHALRVIGAAPNPPALDEGLRRRYGVPEVVPMYGMTEVNIPLWGRLGEVRAGSCGRLWAEAFELDILDPQSQRPVAAGQSGEIVVRPRIAHGFMAGYHRMPEQTVEAWRGLWFHTGDSGRLAADGHVEFLDRIKDCIRRRGENLSSSVIEDLLSGHPAIAEVAAVAMPSPLPGGEDEVHLVIVPSADPALGAAELAAIARQRLPRWAWPYAVSVVDALPKTPTGKPRKQALKALQEWRERWIASTD